MVRPLRPPTAFAVAALGIGLFSVMDAFMKSLTLAIGVYNALLWRTGISVPLGLAAWRIEGARRPDARVLRIHLARGTLATVMALTFFWGLARVPMAQAIGLAYIAPLLALLMGALFLGERVGRQVVFGSLAALVGVGVILLGQREAALGHEAFVGAIAVLVSAVLYAGNLVIARVQSQAAKPGEIAFFQSSIVFTQLLLAAPWLAVLPGAAEWPKLVIGAMLATSSLFLLAWAYAHGEAGYLAMTEYTGFLYAATLGFLVFGERLSPWTLAGAAIIVAACLYAARRRDIVQPPLEGVP